MLFCLIYCLFEDFLIGLIQGLIISNYWVVVNTLFDIHTHVTRHFHPIISTLDLKFLSLVFSVLSYFFAFFPNKTLLKMSAKSEG